MDGKAIAGTLVAHKATQQNLMSVVSLYCQQQGVVSSPSV